MNTEPATKRTFNVPRISFLSRRTVFLLMRRTGVNDSARCSCVCLCICACICTCTVSDQHVAGCLSDVLHVTAVTVCVQNTHVT